MFPSPLDIINAVPVAELVRLCPRNWHEGSSKCLLRHTNSMRCVIAAAYHRSPCFPSVAGHYFSRNFRSCSVDNPATPLSGRKSLANGGLISCTGSMQTQDAPTEPIHAILLSK